MIACLSPGVRKVTTSRLETAVDMPRDDEAI
jgi:hypothetical protein